MYRKLILFTFSILLLAGTSNFANITDVTVSWDLVQSVPNDGPSDYLDNDERLPPVDGWAVVPIDMGELWLDVDLEDHKQVDLEGVRLVALLKLEGGELIVTGTINHGEYLDGIVDLSASTNLARPWTFSGKGYSALLVSGPVTINVRQNALTRVAFSGASMEVDIESPEGDSLVIKGSISNGTYKPGEGITFEGRLTLVPPFTYKKDKVTVGFNSGDEITVEVKQSEFKEATFNLTVQAGITIKGDVLKLKGPVEGKINDSYDIDFYGSITVMADFTKTFGDSVSVTLKEGGKLGVEVEQSEFQWAELENITVEVNIDIGGKDLKLGGEINKGKYYTNSIDFKGSLSLLEDFNYKKNPISITLASGGDVDVTVKENELKTARFDGLTCTVSVTAPDGSQQTTKVTLDKGVYRNGIIHLQSKEFETVGLTRKVIIRIDDDDDEEDEKPAD